MGAAEFVARFETLTVHGVSGSLTSYFEQFARKSEYFSILSGLLNRLIVCMTNPRP